MGYPVEKINKNTALYSIIGVNAIEEKKDNLFNRYFKKFDVNCRLMSLNIRTDDIGFFLNGLKDSQIKSVIFLKEYWQIVYELLENVTKESEICGICDIITVANREYIADVIQGRAILSLIKENVDLSKSRVVIYGNSPTIKSILFNLLKEDVKETVLCDKTIENTIELSKIYPDADIYRVLKNITIDDADVYIDASGEIKIDSNPKFVLNLQQDMNIVLEKIAEIKTKEWCENV